MKLENIADSASKIIRNGWKGKGVREGYLISALVGATAGLLYLQNQHFTARYMQNLGGIFLFVNVCHHAFIGINRTYTKL